MESTQVIRWGVIGPGRAAGRFAEGLKAVQGVSLAAVWGRNRERTEAYAMRFGVPLIFDTLGQIIAGEIDAVYIATHADTHAQMSILALEAGKQIGRAHV